MCEQTNKNFEWIVIDDGSTDDTGNIVKKWISETSDFRIIYCYTKNGGKHRGLNLGIKLANGEAIINIDSDDYLMADAISFIIEHFPEISEDSRFAGISGLRAYKDGKIIGSSPSFESYLDADTYKLHYHICSGDKAEVYKTSILKKYPFPEFEGENFLSEGVVHFQIAYDGYLIRWFNKVLQRGEYLKDGLSRNLCYLFDSNPKGWAEFMRKRNLFLEGLDEVYKHRYWVLMHKHFDKDELCELLMIDKKQYVQYEKDYQMLIIKINKLLIEEKINTIAVYGCGNNAQFFVDCLNKLQKHIEYGIDQKKSNVLMDKTYYLNDSLPTVDAVFVTPKSITDKEFNSIKYTINKKIKNCKIYALNKEFTLFF